jgi:catechol 2,3-dioxygenase-like lactoylglutathione lyase family enzyme
MRVDHVLETCLYVDDLDAAEAFYTAVLGLECVGREAGRHVFLRCGSSLVLLFNPDRTQQPDNEVPRHGARGAGHVAFAVSCEAVASWRERLRQHGVCIEQEKQRDGGRSIYFRDPAGNSVELATPGIWGLNGQ